MEIKSNAEKNIDYNREKNEKLLDGFYQKYGLIIEGNKRLYSFDLGEKLPLLENCVPYLFKYENIEIYESNRNKMALGILKELDKINHVSEEDLLKLKYDWSLAPVFSKIQRVNFTKFKDIYLNTNHTSTHSMMSIQLLLKTYGVDITKAEFLIRKHFVSEPKEVRDFFINETQKEFKMKLCFNGFSEAKADVYVNNFKVINKLLSKLSVGFDNFFLFDDVNYFACYKNKCIDIAKNEYGRTSKNVISITKTLNQYEEFIRYRDFFKVFSSKSINPKFSLYIKRQILELMAKINFDTISINKLYARISILKESILEVLGKFNNPTYFFLLVKASLKNEFYFSYPFISKSIKGSIFPDELIRTFVYSKDEISVDQIADFVNWQQINGISNYVQFFDSLSNDFVLVDYDKIIRKEKFIINHGAELLNQIKKEISFYINSFGTINSDDFIGYNSLPKINYVWNKAILLGITRTFFRDSFDIIELSGRYKTISYKIIKH